MSRATLPDVERELATQPDCWRDVIGRVDEHRAALPVPGERVMVLGCGTSLYMARTYAELREAAGQGETDAFPASERRRGRRYDRVVAISRSGTTTEILDALREVGDTTPRTAITADHATPVATLASDVIALTGATERSVVQTRFPTTVLALLRASLGEDLSEVIADAATAVTAELPVAAGSHRQFTFLGLGWAAGIADEAALKCREAAGAWTESYPAMEYRHGPIAVSGPSTVVWVFGTIPSRLAADIAATGTTLVQSDLDPMADLIRAQRLGVALAQLGGRDPDHPRSLAFSVVLDDES